MHKQSVRVFLWWKSKEKRKERKDVTHMDWKYWAEALVPYT